MHACMGYMILPVLITFTFISEPFFVVHLLFLTLFFFFTNLQREEAFESTPSSERLFGQDFSKSKEGCVCVCV